MLVAEYDYNMDIRVQREESYNAGRAEGMATGRAEGRAEGIATGRAEGIATGRAEGRIQGSYDTKIETAKNLIEMGMSAQNISKATGLSQEEIAKL